MAKKKVQRGRVGKRRLKFENELIEAHVTYARKIASQFYRRRVAIGFEKDEFESAAFLGLCEAAKRFDPKRQGNFRTFSYLRMRGAMYDLMRSNGEKRRSHFQALLGRYRIGSKCAEESVALLRADLPNPPSSGAEACAEDGEEKDSADSEFLSPGTFITPNELASFVNAHDDFGITLRLNAELSQVQLCYAAGDDPEDRVLLAERRRTLLQAVEVLPKRERAIIEMHYLEEKNYRQITRRLRTLSKSRISQIHHRALGRLRDQLLREERAPLLQRWA